MQGSPFQVGSYPHLCAGDANSSSDRGTHQELNPNTGPGVANHGSDQGDTSGVEPNSEAVGKRKALKC